MGPEDFSARLGSAWDMVAVPGLSFVNGVIVSCRSLRIRIRMNHSFNLTDFTAWGVKYWVQGNFRRSSGSAPIIVFRWAPAKNLKIFHPEGLPCIYAFGRFPATSGEWAVFVSSPARLLFLGWLNRAAASTRPGACAALRTLPIARTRCPSPVTHNACLNSLPV